MNVANLLLGRSTLRQRELTVRAALGAGRGRIVRQVLAEGLLLSVLGTAGGVAFAWEAVEYLRRASPVEMPVGTEVVVGWPVLAFSAISSGTRAAASSRLPSSQRRWTSVASST